MASKEVWENYRSSNPDKGSDYDIRSMMADTATTFRNLTNMYGSGADLVLHGIISTYQNLQDIAMARNIRDYPRLA